MVSNLNIVTWNACGLRNKVGSLINFLSVHKIDIMFINETKLSADQKFRIRGYKVLRKDNSSGLIARGGLCAIIKNNIPFQEISTPATNLETLAIKLADASVLISVYNSPSNNFAELDIKKLINLGTKLIILGDFNARHKNWNCNTNNRNGITLNNVVLKNNVALLQTESPTHFPPNNTSPSYLDLVLVKNVKHISQPTTLCELDSDHDAVKFIIFNQIKNNEKIKITSYAHTNWLKFRKYLDQNIKITPNINTNTQLEKEVESFTDILSKAKRLHSKTITIDRYKDQLPPQVVSVIKEKNHLRRLWQRSQNAVDYSNYKNKIREAANAIKNHRDNSWSAKLSRLSSKDNSLWKLSKTLRNNYTTIPTLIENNKAHITDAQKAELLSQVYSNTGSEILENMTDPNLHLPVEEYVKEFLKQHTACQINDRSKFHASRSEIIRELCNLPNNKAPGVDEIDNKILKNLSHKAVLQLTNIVNAMLNLKYFPEKWKIAVAIPFRKPGRDARNPNNYRIISLLNTTAKLAEKIILNRLDKLEKSLKITKAEQFGFRKGHSTTMQVTRIVNDIALNFNKNKITQMSLLDIEKAFDSVWISGLIYKLINYKFPPEIIILLNSYLCNRKMKIKVNESMSTMKTINAGVPQGSVLGPRLFCLYINDIPSFEKTNLGMYADDTAIYSHSFHAEVANKQIQIHISQLEKYFKQWKIKLNANKTENITFSKKFTCNKVYNHLKVENHTVPVSKQVKYLGVILDNRLNFTAHINNLLKKGFAALRALYPLLLNKKLCQNNKKLLYTAIIRPVICYAAPVWANISNTKYRKLQIFQNKCLRLILNESRYCRITKLHKKSGLPTIKEFVLNQSKKFYDIQIKNSYLTRSIKHTKNLHPHINFKHKLPFPGIY